MLYVDTQVIPESLLFIWMNEYFSPYAWICLYNYIMVKMKYLIFLGITPYHEHHLEWGAGVSHSIRWGCSSWGDCPKGTQVSTTLGSLRKYEMLLPFMGHACI